MERISTSRYNLKAAESQALEIILMMIRKQTKVEDKNLTPFWNSVNYFADVERHFQIQMLLMYY
jgi:hypothetical protein